jgi:iron complex transport system ATP-binding protein
MLMAHDLCVSRGDALILRDLSLAVEPGTLTALLGRNGAGKSTLLKVLAGEFHSRIHAGTAQVRGTLTLNGEPLAAFDAQRLARLRAVLPQASHPAFSFSVEEIVLLGRYPHARHAGAWSNGDRDIACRALERAGASTLAGRDVTTLSGGERARVQFARVLAQLWPADGDGRDAPARYLLLDEPTAALDLAHQHHLLATVRLAHRRTDDRARPQPRGAPCGPDRAARRRHDRRSRLAARHDAHRADRTMLRLCGADAGCRRRRAAGGCAGVSRPDRPVYSNTGRRKLRS